MDIVKLRHNRVDAFGVWPRMTDSALLPRDRAAIIRQAIGQQTADEEAAFKLFFAIIGFIFFLAFMQYL